MVSYVKDNFLNARTFTGLDDLNAQGRAWLATPANARVHATTKARPCDLLAREDAHTRWGDHALPGRPLRPAHRGRRGAGAF